jgi:hypothetical protein
MRPDALAELCAIMRGESAQSDGTAGTDGTLNIVPAQKCPSFHVFHLFRPEHDNPGNEHSEPGTTAGTFPLDDDVAVAERAAIAIELGRVPPAYAGAWAVFQMRKPGQLSEAAWFQAIDDAGRFLDEWASLALDFGWRPNDIFGQRGLARFCTGERVRAVGPDNAITASGRIFTRQQTGGA